MTSRRLSQAISEGDGISVVVAVDGPEAARTAEESGAEAVLVHSGLEGEFAAIRSVTELPILFFFDGQEADALLKTNPADPFFLELKGQILL